MTGKRAMLFLYLALVAAALFGSPALAQSPRGLDELVVQALADSPDLKAAEANWRMMRHRIAPAAALEDPSISFALSNYPVDTFRWNQTFMTGEMIKVAQSFPFPGKLAAKGKIAEQQALWFRGVFEDSRLQLIRQVKEAWYQLFLAERTLDRTEASIGLLDNIIRLAENSYETGQGLQQDVLRAQVERSMLTERLLIARQQRISALASLNALRNQEPETPVAVPDDLQPEPFDFEMDELHQMAVTLRPMARAYQALIGQYQAMTELAKLEFSPDFFASAAYSFQQDTPEMKGTDLASLEIGMTVPLNQGRRREMAAEARAAHGMAKNQYDDFQNKTRLAIHDAHAQMKRSEQLMLLYRQGIIPQVTQSLEAAVIGYQVGKVGFSALLDTLLTLYRYQVESYRVVAEYGQNLARLEAEAGLAAEALPPPEPAGDAGIRPDPQEKTGEVMP